MRKVPNNQTLEEAVLDFIEVWEDYWESGPMEGPSKKDLDRAFAKIKKLAKKSESR